MGAAWRRRARGHTSDEWARRPCHDPEPSAGAVIEIDCRPIACVAARSDRRGRGGLHEVALSQALEQSPVHHDPDSEDGAGSVAPERARRDACEERERLEARGGRPPAQAADARRAREGSLRSTMRRHPLAVAAVAIAIVAGLVGALIWWMNARHYESTDDAF